MILTSLGHAKFLLELDGGLRLVTDPYDPSCGYPIAPVQADAALVSHGHHDHCAVDTLGGHPQVLNQAGTFTLAPGVQVTALSAFHDDAQGQKRGATLLFLLEAEGLRVAHLGDLGHPLTPALRSALAPVDVLMLPVGGHFTIDAPTARDVAASLRARVIVPMHYRTPWTAAWPIAPLEDFTSLYPAQAVSAPLPLLRVTAGDLPCQPHVAVLAPQV